MEFLLSSEKDHDALHAIALLSKADLSQSNVLGDKAYGAKLIRDYITAQGGQYTIPPRSNAKEPWEYDEERYKKRHLVECFFQKIKWFRRIASRYDKSDDSFLAFVHLAAISILLN